MVEQFCRVQLDELRHARIVCPKCGTALEVPMDRLALFSGGVQCTGGCGHVLCGGGGTDRESVELSRLGKAVEALLGMKSRFSVEFLIPLPTK
jgi:hypothetical protein